MNNFNVEYYKFNVCILLQYLLFYLCFNNDFYVKTVTSKLNKFDKLYFNTIFFVCKCIFVGHYNKILLLLLLLLYYSFNFFTND